MTLLYDRIKIAQNGNENAQLELVYKFEPLLRKYARKLSCDDAYGDLYLKLYDVIMTANFVGMRNHQDKYIISYIERCIYNEYLFYAKKRRTESLNTAYSLDDEAQNLNSACLAVDEEYPFIDYSILESILTRNEAEIVQYICALKYPLKDVAAWYHISPSAVCQTKTKALNKLREYYKKQDSGQT